MKKILETLGIERLTPMQEASIEAFWTDSDIVLLSPTGTGKTLAYLIPLVKRLDPSLSSVQAIVLVPSRELALQTEQVLKAMGTDTRAMCCYGGRPAMDEHRKMKALSPSIIIATPGRMNDHLDKANFDPSAVTLLVIDEFDKCLELGFRDEMSEVISKLPSLRRRFLLSATDADEIPAFLRLGKTLRLDFSADRGDSRVKTFKVCSPSKDKLETLFRLLCSLGKSQSLVFCNHRESVDRVSAYLRKMKMHCESYHGGMDQDIRERSLFEFRNRSSLVLVSTDLAARGLDIPSVRNIVHYHLPLDNESFIHRNGRTARWDADGKAYVIVGPEEQLPDYLGPDIPALSPPLPPSTAVPPKPEYVTFYVGKGKKDKLSKADIMGFFCKKGGLSRSDIGMIEVRDNCCYAAISSEKSRQTLSLVRGEKIKGIKTIVELAK